MPRRSVWLGPLRLSSSARVRACLSSLLGVVEPLALAEARERPDAAAPPPRLRFMPAYCERERTEAMGDMRKPATVCTSALARGSAAATGDAGGEGAPCVESLRDESSSERRLAEAEPRRRAVSRVAGAMPERRRTPSPPAFESLPGSGSRAARRVRWTIAACGAAAARASEGCGGETASGVQLRVVSRPCDEVERSGGADAAAERAQMRTRSGGAARRRLSACRARFYAAAAWTSGELRRERERRGQDERVVEVGSGARWRQQLHLADSACSATVGAASADDEGAGEQAHAAVGRCCPRAGGAARRQSRRAAACIRVVARRQRGAEIASARDRSVGAASSAASQSSLDPRALTPARCPGLSGPPITRVRARRLR